MFNENTQIDIYDFDGVSISNQTRICSRGEFSTPSWSHDGTKIIFAGIRDGGCVNPAFFWDGAKIIFTNTGSNGDYEIFSINSDGSSKTNLTNNAAYYLFYNYD